MSEKYAKEAEASLKDATARLAEAARKLTKAAESVDARQLSREEAEGLVSRVTSKIDEIGEPIARARTVLESVAGAEAAAGLAWAEEVIKVFEIETPEGAVEAE